MLVAPTAALADGATVGPLTGTEATPLPSTTTVATFNDGIDVAFCNASDGYAATINWGDGSPTSAGTVVGPISPTITHPCSYAVEAGHTYAQPGSYTITVSVTGGMTPISGLGTATISDAPLTAGPPLTIRSTAGTAFSGAVGTFKDANTSATASSYAATISWGDGATSPGVVSATSTAGTFVVSGGHTYATVGTLGLTISVADSGGSQVTLAGAAIVAAPVPPPPPPMTPIQTFTPKATAGVNLQALLATFADAETGTTAASYSATVSWGDGATTAGTVVAGGTTGQFGVVGSHTYASAGSYRVGITVTAPLNRELRMSTTVTVAAAPKPPPPPPPPPTTLAVTLSHVTAVAGRGLRATVGCPASAHSCRGFLSAYVGSSASGTLIASTLFILTGGHSGTIDLTLTPAERRHFRHRSVSLTVVARAGDPATKLTGSASTTISARLR